MKIFVIVVTYKGHRWYNKCFSSLQKQSIPVQVVVVDNASNDGTIEFIRKDFSEFVLIESRENLGFGRANNIGMRYALEHDCDYLFLNNQCARYVEQQLHGKKIDVVHSNSAITTVGTNIAQRLRVPHIWHIREFLDLDFNVSVYGGRQRLVNQLNTAAARICISQAVCHYWKLLKNNTFVVPDVIFYSPFTRKQQKFFLFTATVVSEKKGADVAVQAFRLSRLHKEGYSLLIVGSCTPEMQEYLFTIAGESKDFISFENYSTQMVLYYQQAVALLMRSPCEALGRVTVEAMLAECPVIGRDTGGTMEIIGPNRTGFLFSTTEECAKCMRTIVSMNTSEIVMNAKMFAMEHFGDKQFKYRIHQVYKSVLP